MFILFSVKIRHIAETQRLECLLTWYYHYTAFFPKFQTFFHDKTQRPSTSRKLKHGDLTGEC